MHSTTVHNPCKNLVAWCQRTISLVLVFVMLGNLGAEAAGLSNFSSGHIRRQVEETIDQLAQNTPAKTPQQFLNDLREEFEKAFEDPAPAADVPTKPTEQEYAATYTQEVEKVYKEQLKKMEKEAKAALAEFDRAAQAAYEKESAALQTGDLDEAAAQQLQQQLDAYRELLQQGKEDFTAEIEAQKTQYRADLAKEKQAFLAALPQEYQRYSHEFDTAMQEAADAQVAFYKDMVRQIVANYKQTTDQLSKENFVSLITFLSSFQNKDQFIAGEERKYIKEVLQHNFVAQRGACKGRQVTQYKPDSSWGTTGMGGSPSAGRMFDVQTNKTFTFELDNEEKCNLAISSLIPFANLNGNGLAITYFLKENLDNPMFGQMLLVGAKALVLTKNKNMEAFAKLVDAAMEAENAGAKKSVWSSLDMFTGEGIARQMSMFDGKYMSHNVSASGKREPGEPNVWEDVAQLLAEYNTPQADAILHKAIEQCRVKVSGQYPSEKQSLECKGIYPFLLGALTQKPQLAERLRVTPRVNQNAGQEFTANGSVRVVTEQEAAIRRAYNEQHDITRKYSRAELLGAFFYRQFFEDLYPADKQRMDSLIAQNPVLNPQQRMVAYAVTDEAYQKLVQKFNRNTVFVALGSAVDYIITLVLIKDLGLLAFRLGAFAKNITNAVKIRRVIMEYRHLPLSVNKSLKIAHGLQARGIGATQLQSHRAFVAKVGKIKTTFQKIPQLRSKIITRLSVGQVPSMPQMKPLRRSSAPHHLRKPSLGKRVKFDANITEFQPANAAYVGGLNQTAASPWGQFKVSFQHLWERINPKATASGKKAFEIDMQGLTLTLRNQKGVVETIPSMGIEGGTLYVGKDMLKTYKAFLPMDQVGPLAALAREEKVSLGIDGMWIKLVDKTAKPTRWEKMRALNHLVKDVPLFDEAGLQIMRVGFNPGYKAEKALLGRIGNGAQLVFKNNQIYLKENGLLKTLQQFKEISIPKMAISNMAKGNQASFLNKLFHLPAKANGALRFERTGSKLFWPMAVNVLSYSAASSSLMMTLEKEPFNLPPQVSIGVGLAFPYVSCLLAPLFAPVVSKLGARPVLGMSLLAATGALTIASSVGYNSNITYEKDVNGKVLLDGKGEPIIRKDRPTVWPLVMTSLLTGLASTGIRATSNVIVKSYELSQRTMNVSMLFKSVGGMMFTAVPFAWNSYAKAADKNPVDFSLTYPILAGMSLLTYGGLRATMPKMASATADLSRAAFAKPWKFLTKKEVWPYVSGIMLMSSLEGYVYFKGLNAFARDVYQKDLGAKKENAKFFSSLTTAIPQIIMRRWSPRKAYFGWGLANSAVLSLAGTGLLMLPTENSSTAANIAIGAASGMMIGFGTAQVFQYNQKLLNAAVVANYGEKMLGTGQVLYAMGNFGFVFPALFGMAAQKRKELYNESDFFSTQRTFKFSIGTYLAGLGLIAGAQARLLPDLTVLWGGVKKAAPAIGRWIPPVVGGATLLNAQGPSQLPAPKLLQDGSVSSLLAPSMPQLQPADLKINTQPAFKTNPRFSFGPKADFQLQPAE